MFAAQLMEFPAQMSAFVSRAEGALDRFVPKANVRPVRLHTAMRYSLEAGGKRLRPVLVLATAELLGAKPTAALPAAAAIECIHTYSLMHDDLPCMDNDDLRRGRPTAHKQFDEATALLAGDALLTHAFALLATEYPPSPGFELVRELATAAGSRHLIGGQMEDLLAEKKQDATAEELEFIHLNKTAALIQAALVMGGLVAQAPSDTIATLRGAGRSLGLAFQIVDDILDATADTAALGKTAGKDAKSGKTTFVSLHGLAAAQQLADEQSHAAVAAFKKLPGDSKFLIDLTEEMLRRKR